MTAAPTENWTDAGQSARPSVQVEWPGCRYTGIEAQLNESRDATVQIDSVTRERQGRRWLIWSFVFCPCHLPVSMAALAAIFGGSAFGTLLSRNTLGVGLVFGAVYAAGVAIGFRHLRAAAAGKDCSGDSCELS